MAEDSGEEEVKKGKPIVKIILIVLGVVVLLALAVGGTLFATGFFDPKPEEAAQAKIEQLEGEAAAAAGAKCAQVGENLTVENPLPLRRESPRRCHPVDMGNDDHVGGEAAQTLDTQVPRGRLCIRFSRHC